MRSELCRMWDEVVGRGYSARNQDLGQCMPTISCPADIVATRECRGWRPRQDSNPRPAA